MHGAEQKAETLVPFDDGRAGAPGWTVRGAATRERTTLLLRFTVAAEPGAIRVPARERVPRRRDELWRHTCFEAFLAPEGSPAYWEVNLAPSGDWNVYRFAGYRSGMAQETRIGAPETAGERPARGALALRAALDVGAIRELAGGRLEVGLAAVLERSDGALAYLALRHAGERPDFHRRDGFVLRLG